MTEQNEVFTDRQMWSREWMDKNYAELRPCGQGFVDRLREGKSMQEATMWFVTEGVKLYRPDSIRTEFERCIDRQFEQAFKRWEKGPGRRH